MAKVKITVEGYRCERCQYEWIPRTKIDTEPTICPRCKSAYWNKPRTNKKRGSTGHAKETN